MVYVPILGRCFESEMSKTPYDLPVRMTFGHFILHTMYPEATNHIELEGDTMEKN